jgi:hypothetical protein
MGLGVVDVLRGLAEIVVANQEVIKNTCEGLIRGRNVGH